jgi:hypothetical protein
VRQRYFGWTAGGLLILQTAYASFILASVASTLAQANCGYAWRTLVVLQFFQVRLLYWNAQAAALGCACALRPLLRCGISIGRYHPGSPVMGRRPMRFAPAQAPQCCSPPLCS